MANFFKSDTSDRRGYDASVNKQYLLVGQISDVTLWGGGDDDEKLAIALNDPSVAKCNETPLDQPHLRCFLVRGDRLGNAMLEARSSTESVWAFMQIEVVEAIPLTGPPVSATPGEGKTTVKLPVEPTHFVTSEAAKQWMRNSEALRLDYYDIDSQAAVTDVSKRNCTVGWGHLVHRGACREGEAGQSITLEKAIELFQSDVEGKERFVNSKGYSLTQTEFEAMVDLAFQSWPKDIHDPLKSGDKDSVADILQRIGGERGVRRRTLYTEGRYVDRGNP